MAQKPVPNALTLELEPVVQQELRRHIDTEELWYAHEYVPFDQGENFAFLGGRDWDPSQVTLPRHITDALEILLITKDNLAGYHREIVFSFILENKWGRWIGRWTAEEHLHAVALRNYLVVTREIDPAANEAVRVEHVMKGYRADHYTQIERLAFMSFFERAHAVYCRNLQDQITEPVLKSLLDRIAKDEERHEQFWSNLVAHCLQTHRDETVEAIARRAAELGVVGGDIEPYQDKVANVAKTGIFDEAALRTVISDRITAWDLAAEPRLSQFVTSS
ncbi:acyl-ACP desaturase [Mycolicibacterium thermoresistibile]|uniref:Fatty acid desaturase, type 2 n=2 Tax=Mycolicibacterium thermoresistibile TaxID=1797 RepID=G7CC75_MYCT3|nr:acyl-ACP desaturase [Mycolicibacterium thermoresistibile]EHI14338.1 fatty acid desaturase, type 2 [Mycolicibacterium thermoresistibile ATCC 19527]MCV7189503.1 acyl-ACP desaturase [Mycolicibacterium thermoresistibile]GAT14490.1 acyl-[acyl-carrier protein] desaturase desA2 [Mycolicibacterium thermoresistibile]